MARYTPTGNISTVPQINSELEKISEAIKDTLSRTGDIPNQMAAPLDMNGFPIVNAVINTEDSDIDLDGYATIAEMELGDANTLAEAKEYADSLSYGEGGGSAPTPGIFDITEYGAVADNVTDNKAAIDAALAALESNGGGVLYIPPMGVFRTTGYHTIPDNMKIKGEGWNSCLKVLRITGNSTVPPIFEKVPSTRPSFPYSNIILEGVRFEGVLDEDNGVEATSPGLVVMVGFNKVLIKDCYFYYASSVAFKANECYEIAAYHNDFRYAARDLCDFWNCPRTITVGNRFMYNDDDVLAMNTERYERPENVAHSKHIITNNIFVDTGQIRIQLPKEVIISNNISHRCHDTSFCYLAALAVTNKNTSNPHSIIISNNVINDRIDRSIAAPSVGPTEGFRAVFKLVAIPETDNSNYGGYYTNTGETNSLPIKGARGIHIHGNIVKRTLPAVTNYSDWGFGEQWAVNDETNFAPNGFHDPEVTDELMQVRCVELTGPFNGVYIKDNVFDHSSVQVFKIYTANYTPVDMDYKDIVIANNHCKDFKVGIDLSSIGGTRQDITIQGNIFDGDPLLRLSATRATAGTFQNGSDCIAINTQNVVGTKILGNTFKNVAIPYAVSSAVVSTVAHGNTFIGEPSEGYNLNTFVTSNKGVGQYPSEIIEDSSLFIYEDSDPTSPTYGEVLHYSKGVGEGLTPPGSGYYFKGEFLRSRLGVINGSNTSWGLRRLISGTGQTLGTDWEALEVIGGSGSTPTPNPSDSWVYTGRSLDMTSQLNGARGVNFIGTTGIAVLDNDATSRRAFVYNQTTLAFENGSPAIPDADIVSGYRVDDSDYYVLTNTEINRYNGSYVLQGSFISGGYDGLAVYNDEFYVLDGSTITVYDSAGVPTGATIALPSGSYEDITSRDGFIKLFVLRSDGKVFSMDPDGSFFQEVLDTSAQVTGARALDVAYNVGKMAVVSGTMLYEYEIDA